MQPSNNPPRHLICTISGQIYLEPVTVYPSGHVYEKDMIDKLIADAAKRGAQALCPLSLIPIENYVKARGI